jgi:uncharacterized protein YjbJ (UPF0337 family)
MKSSGNSVIQPDTKENTMNWDQIEGKWKQFAGSARERWGKLTDDDVKTAAGKKENLVGRIQERYGIAKEEAEKQADQWSAALEDSARAARSQIRK